ncbi:hypothetical protein [Streptomyces formicae]
MTDSLAVFPYRHADPPGIVYRFDIKKPGMTGGVFDEGFQPAGALFDLWRHFSWCTNMTQLTPAIYSYCDGFVGTSTAPINSASTYLQWYLGACRESTLEALTSALQKRFTSMKMMAAVVKDSPFLKGASKKVADIDRAIDAIKLIELSENIFRLPGWLYAIKPNKYFISVRENSTRRRAKFVSDIADRIDMEGWLYPGPISSKAVSRAWPVYIQFDLKAPCTTSSLVIDQRYQDHDGAAPDADSPFKKDAWRGLIGYHAAMTLGTKTGKCSVPGSEGFTRLLEGKDWNDEGEYWDTSSQQVPNPHFPFGTPSEVESHTLSFADTSKT